MKIITIPVSRLTRAVMLSDHGPEPIKLERGEIRLRQLMHVGTPNKYLERKQEALDTIITLQVSKHVHDHLRSRGDQVGFFLYAQDKVSIFRFVWARVTGGMEALRAIKDYYQLHQMEEDDFSIETAERLWKRWRAKKEKDRGTRTPRNVPQSSPVLLSRRQAETLISRIEQFISEAPGIVDPRYLTGVRSWVLADLTPMSFRQIAIETRRTKKDEGRSAQRFRGYLQHNKELRTFVAYALKTTEAAPTPSVAS